MGDEWGTPQDLFDGVVKKVGSFDLDVCASKDNYNRFYFGNVHFWTCDREYNDVKRVSY